MTEMTVLSGEAMRRIAATLDLRAILRRAMVAVSRREVVMPLRWGLELPDRRGLLGMMPGYYGPDDVAGIKVISLVPPALREGRSSHLGLMVLYDASGLVPRALLCGATLTALRTAQASAIATDALARADAQVLAILGTGEQAQAHIAALHGVRDFSALRVWGRDPDAARRLVERVRGLYPSADACERVEDAVRGADVLCTVTASATPVLHGASLAAGTHVNLVGSSTPDKMECDVETVRRARLFVDYRPSAEAQAGELREAVRTGTVAGDPVVGEIGEVIAGDLVGRTTPGDITVYKSLGVSAQDLSVAKALLDAAERAGEGVKVAL
jgi:ornithine cyclodeaminase